MTEALRSLKGILGWCVTSHREPWRGGHLPSLLASFFAVQEFGVLSDPLVQSILNQGCDFLQTAWFKYAWTELLLLCTTHKLMLILRFNDKVIFYQMPSHSHLLPLPQHGPQWTSWRLFGSPRAKHGDPPAQQSSHTVTQRARKATGLLRGAECTCNKGNLSVVDWQRDKPHRPPVSIRVTPIPHTGVPSLPPSVRSSLTKLFMKNKILNVF